MLTRLFVFALIFAFGCTPSTPDTAAPDEESETTPSFADDLAFLESYGEVQVLQAPHGPSVALSALYQGRVMTSAVTPDQPSLGWINYDFIRSGETGGQFDNYGGEDRFWIGPEGGQYSYYFAPGSEFVFSEWQVPAALHVGAWDITDQSDQNVTFATSMHVTNYSGFVFDMEVERSIRLLSNADVAYLLDVAIPEGVQWVGYEANNKVTNAGVSAWTKTTGMPSVWILGMYNPFDATTVVIPFRGSADDGAVNDEYFGAVPADRLSVNDGYLSFFCDGDYRSKIGIGPDFALPVAGSYCASKNMLTLVQFSLPEGVTDYVNGMWELQEDPFSGDAVNSYNDGPPEPGVPPLGGFYELESSSPALALAPGESYTHTHRTFHLSADPATLDEIARAVLGVPAVTIAGER